MAYEYVEVNPYQVDPQEAVGYTKQSLSLQEKQALMPSFMETSPRGLVPAILDRQGGHCIWESSVIVEYLDQVYGEKKQPLMTPFPEGQALIRICVEHCTSRIQKSYYTFLMAPTEEAQIKAKQEFFRECRALACAMAPVGIHQQDGKHVEPSPASILQATITALEEDKSAIQRVDVGTLSRVSQEALTNTLKLEPGPFFLGSAFSAVDIALAPFWQRILWVGGHYRNLKLPKDAAFERLNLWWQAVMHRPSVANTFVGKERLISSYRQYAFNVATSDLANTMKASLEGTAPKKQKTDS